MRTNPNLIQRVENTYIVTVHTNRGNKRDNHLKSLIAQVYRAGNVFFLLESFLQLYRTMQELLCSDVASISISITIYSHKISWQ